MESKPGSLRQPEGFIEKLFCSQGCWMPQGLGRVSCTAGNLNKSRTVFEGPGVYPTLQRQFWAGSRAEMQVLEGSRRCLSWQTAAQGETSATESRMVRIKHKHTEVQLPKNAQITLARSAWHLLPLPGLFPVFAPAGPGVLAALWGGRFPLRAPQGPSRQGWWSPGRTAAFSTSFHHTYTHH